MVLWPVLFASASARKKKRAFSDNVSVFTSWIYACSSPLSASQGDGTNTSPSTNSMRCSTASMFSRRVMKILFCSAVNGIHCVPDLRISHVTPIRVSSLGCSPLQVCTCSEARLMPLRGPKVNFSTPATGALVNQHQPELFSLIPLRPFFTPSASFTTSPNCNPRSGLLCGGALV